MRVLLALFAHAGRITSITSRTQPGCCTIRNPGENQVEFTLGAEPRDLYDAVAKEFVRRGVRGVVRVTIGRHRPGSCCQPGRWKNDCGKARGC